MRPAPLAPHPLILVTLLFAVLASSLDAAEIEQSFASLPLLTEASNSPATGDWLVTPIARKAGVYRREGAPEVVLTNGLLRRTFRIRPDGATVGFDNLTTGTSVIRGVKPEAVLRMGGRSLPVGGLAGQPDYAYLLPVWIDALTRNAEAFHLTGLQTGPTRERFPWKRGRRSEDRPWPPPGVALTLTFRHDTPALAGIEVDVCYELYDGLPLLSKWLVIRNAGPETVRLDSFTSEILAVVEPASDVEVPDRWRTPPLHVESDYAFHGMSYGSANETTHWVPDPQYSSQVNYRRLNPVQLESRPKLGPGLDLPSGEHFETFRTYELLHDSDDRERRGLAVRRMYRTLAPWVTENPILMHVRHSDRESVRRAIDQCAEVGFEMVILTFGSGFDMENEDPAYRQRIREDVEYGHSRGIEVGGYSLLASRRISAEHDVIHPESGEPGGAIYGHSPCLASAWGRDYFRKIRSFIEDTGLDLLEHDGNYPGDVCASTRHPHHRDLEDSQWVQWRTITDFYRWCRGRGVYLNVPDWYFLNGSNKVGMGYRETNWSLPRDRQIILGRQNIYDGTWEKTPSMGWMFVPLVEYHGGGAAATLEPLRDHLGSYEAHLRQNFGSGVQACYRGPRLYDSPETRDVVKRWVSFYRRHRDILDSDVVHLRRPDGRDLDGLLHVHPGLSTRGLSMLHNPTGQEIRKEIRIPLYYAGLVDTVRVRDANGATQVVTLERDHHARIVVAVPPHGSVWHTFERP